MLDTNLTHDLVIGLDRSDRKADLHFINTTTGETRSETLASSPENLRQWLLNLRQKYPKANVGICLEQPAGHLIPFLETYDWITLYPINPISLQKYREAFVTSRAKDDYKDALFLADLLANHPDKLKAWQPQDSQTRLLQQLVTHRRAVIDERTALTNRLQALLKAYFPQALELGGDELWRPLGTAFLLKWPTLTAWFSQPETHRSAPQAGRTGGSCQRRASSQSEFCPSSSARLPATPGCRFHRQRI